MQWIVWTFMFVEENIYFGWNVAPKNDAELIADLILGLAAIVILTRGRQGQ